MPEQTQGRAQQDPRHAFDIVDIWTTAPFETTAGEIRGEPQFSKLAGYKGILNVWTNEVLSVVPDSQAHRIMERLNKMLEDVARLGITGLEQAQQQREQSGR